MRQLSASRAVRAVDQAYGTTSPSETLRALDESFGSWGNLDVDGAPYVEEVRPSGEASIPRAIAAGIIDP